MNMLRLPHNQVFKFLSTEEVKLTAASAFTKIAAPRSSDRYVAIATPWIMEQLIDHNWRPVSAYEVRAKKSENKGFQKHFIKFRNEDIYVGDKDGVELIPELLLINSYDARCAMKLAMGMFRVACNNGLIVKSDDLDAIHIPHKGYSHETLFKELLPALEKNTERAVDFVGRTKGVTLNKDQQKHLAQECCRARWDYKYNLLDASQVLDVWRPEDKSDDLWTVFNRIQEKIVKGGWTGSAGRCIKPLLDPNRELKVNTKLFQVLDNFLTQLTKKGK